MAFERIDTKIDGLVLVQPRVISDDRGFFFETYRRNEYATLGIDVEFVQDNHSRSVHGTIRALHFQLRPGQAKLIRCARGSVYDVAVDLRKESPTYGQHEAFVLSDKNAQQVFIPVGFAHGFCVTSEEAIFAYKCTEAYRPETEVTIAHDDPALGIPWPVTDPTLSKKDLAGLRLAAVAPERLPRYAR
jgi:dTDP-4-dehydrorhamnose 3,5-epimerase